MNLESVKEAWREFKDGVGFQAFLLEEPDEGPGLAAPLAWLLAPWKPLGYRFRWYNRERLFQPNKAERRQRLADLSEYVFICGASEWDESRWVEVDALVAEFGGAFPPRDWEPMSVAQMVGQNMGMTQEEVAAIEARVSRPERQAAENGIPW